MTQRSGRALGLAVVDLDGRGDGIAYVARLMRSALADIAGVPPTVVALSPRTSGKVTRWESFRFVIGLALSPFRHGTKAWLVNHLGIARGMSVLPAIVRRPYAVMLNGIEAWDPGLSEDRKRVVREATMRIAISSLTASKVRESHPTLGEIHVCALGLMPERDEEQGRGDDEASYDIGPNAVTIVGRMSASERYKGHDQLIEAWPLVRRKIGDAQLVIVGRGDDAQRLEDKVNTLGVQDAVLFTGFVSDRALGRILRQSAIFAMPSTGEGFGLVYLEAMKEGIPCIGSNVDAAQDVIVDGITGLLVSPQDVEGISQAVVDLLLSPDTRERMGKAGRRRFNEVYSYEAFCERLRGVLVVLEADVAGRGRWFVENQSRSSTWS